MIKSVQYAIAHGAEVINMSWGENSYYSPLQEVIDNAYNAGITVVAAKGNNAKKEIYYPADYNHVISVISTEYFFKYALLKSLFATYNPVAITATQVSLYPDLLNVFHAVFAPILDKWYCFPIGAKGDNAFATVGVGSGCYLGYR